MTRQVAIATVLKHAEGLICLTGGHGGLFNRRAGAGRADEVRARLKELAEAFGDRLYVELQRHGRPEEAAAEGLLIELAYELGPAAGRDQRCALQEARAASVRTTC